MLRISFALAAIAMVATPSMAANRCRDAKGHFIASPQPKPKPVKCQGPFRQMRDAGRQTRLSGFRRDVQTIRTR